jgi:D-serine deaminase-like pyridoxal phosphate-dependent protein
MRKTTRRDWLRASAGIGIAAPFFLVPKPVWGYSVDEVESKLGKGKGVSGVTLNDLPTPSLIIDLDRLEGNIAKMAKHAKAAPINLRPHGKTHKCPEVARRQLKAGAIGLCSATISEAERMADAGIPGILLTSESTGPNKIARLVRLTGKHSDTMAVVDNASNVEQLSEAAVAGKVDLNIMIDIDPVGRRTGIQPGEPALNLAKLVDKLPRLNLRGIHCYSGSSSHVSGFPKRKEHSESVMAPPLETFERMKKDGLPAEIMSGTSTGTYNIDSSLGGMTEMQVGSYVFMDVDYRRIGGKSGSIYNDFQPALTVLGTVISKNYDDRATLDCGLKAFATDRKFGPEVIGITGVAYRFGGDEHGILTITEPSRPVRLGAKFRFIVPHCDPNVNLYDRAYCVRGENVVEVWPIGARGHV